MIRRTWNINLAFVDEFERKVKPDSWESTIDRSLFFCYSKQGGSIFGATFCTKEWKL